MKPFNLEEAKAGKPVCAIDGRPARIICFDRKYGNPKFPIVALILDHNEEIVTIHTVTGESNVRSRLDTLMMAPEKHEGYVNLYRSTDSNKRIPGAYVYNTKEDAIDNSKSLAYITTIKIEWEE